MASEPYGKPVPLIPPAGSTEDIALFPLGTVLVPGMRLALHVFEPRYRQLVADLLSETDPGAPVFGVVALRRGWEVGELGDVFEVGTTARVTDMKPLPDGRCDLAAVGERRFRIEELDTATSPYLRATVRYLDEDDGDIDPGAVERVGNALARHIAMLSALHTETSASITVADARSLSYAVAEHPLLPLADRQELVECRDTASRLSAGRKILRRESLLLTQLRAIPATAAMLRLAAPPS